MLHVVVVPRHTIVVQESEKLLSVLLESFLAFQCGFALVNRAPYVPVESLDLEAVLSEKVALETSPVYRRHDASENLAEFRDNFSDLLVEGMAQHCVVEVAHQVNEALLLQARHGVVCRIEVRHQTAFEFVQQLL